MKGCTLLSKSRKITRVVEKLETLGKETADLEKGITGLKEETSFQISVLEEQAAMLRREVKGLCKGMDELRSLSEFLCEEDLEEEKRVVGDV